MKICLCCGVNQNREICWDCWGDYIKSSKGLFKFDLNIIGVSQTSRVLKHLSEEL